MVYLLYVISAYLLYLAIYYRSWDMLVAAALAGFIGYDMSNKFSDLQRQIAQMPDIAHDQISDELSAGGVLWYIRDERIDTITRAIDKNTNFRIMHDDPSYDIDEVKEKLRVIREEIDEIKERINL